MSIIKNKITIKKIFLIIIFIFNEKFILNASNNIDSCKTLTEKAKLHMRQGELYISLKNYKQAAEEFDKAAQLYYAAGLFYAKKLLTEKSHDLAKAYSNEAFEMYDTAALCYMEKAKSIGNLKNKENEMINIYNNISKCYEKGNKLPYNLINRKLEINDYNNETHNINNILSYRPKKQIYYNIAQNYIKQAELLATKGDRKNAEIACGKAAITYDDAKNNFEEDIKFINIHQQEMIEKGLSTYWWGHLDALKTEANEFDLLSQFYTERKKLFAEERDIFKKGNLYLNIIKMNEQDHIELLRKLTNREQKEIQNKLLEKDKKNLEELVEILIEQAIKSKNIKDTEESYSQASTLHSKLTNNRINNLKLFPCKTTLPISAFGTIIALLKTPKSTLDRACKIPDMISVFENLKIESKKGKIIIVLAVTTTLTGIHSLINNYRHKRLFRCHEIYNKIP